MNIEYHLKYSENNIRKFTHKSDAVPTIGTKIIISDEEIPSFNINCLVNNVIWTMYNPLSDDESDQNYIVVELINTEIAPENIKNHMLGKNK